MNKKYTSLQMLFRTLHGSRSRIFNQERKCMIYRLSITDILRRLDSPYQHTKNARLNIHLRKTESVKKTIVIKKKYIIEICLNSYFALRDTVCFLLWFRKRSFFLQNRNTRSDLLNLF